MLSIDAGGEIRFSFDVNTSSSVTWEDGAIVVLDPATNKLNNVTGTDNAGKVVGVVLEPKSTSTDLSNVPGTGFLHDRTKGSGKASILMSHAIITTDQIASGVLILNGDVLYTNSGGLFTNVASSDAKKLGQSLSTVVGGSSGASLQLWYNPIVI